MLCHPKRVEATQHIAHRSHGKHKHGSRSPQFKAKICIKYSKHESSSFSFTIDCRCLAFFSLLLQSTFEHQTWALQCAETLILYFFVHKKMKKTPSKVGYFSKIAEIFCMYCKKQPGLPRQLHTHIAFSMFPILGTDLWFKASRGRKAEKRKADLAASKCFLASTLRARAPYYASPQQYTAAGL